MSRHAWLLATIAGLACASAQVDPALLRQYNGVWELESGTSDRYTEVRGTLTILDGKYSLETNQGRCGNVPLKLRVASARDTLGTATTFSCGSLLMTIELHDGYVPNFARGTYFVQQQVASNRRCVQRAVDERGRQRGDCVREVEEPIMAQVSRSYRIRMQRKR